MNPCGRRDRIVLENSPTSGSLPVLSDDPKRIQPPEDASLPQPGEDCSLEEAIHDFGAVLRAGGQGDGDEDGLDRSEQILLIEAEAARLGRLFDGLGPAKEGGREHDLAFDASSGTVLKFTKPSSAAFVVDFWGDEPRLSNGDPLGYLERLRLHNEVFGDFTSFVGIGGTANHRRIITRQPIVEGCGASWEAILKLMTGELGFTKLRHNHGIGYEDSYGFVLGDIAVFDIRPANVIMDADDIPVVVDSIPVRVTEDQRKFLLR